MRPFLFSTAVLMLSVMALPLSSCGPDSPASTSPRDTSDDSPPSDLSADSDEQGDTGTGGDVGDALADSDLGSTPSIAITPRSASVEVGFDRSVSFTATVTGLANPDATFVLNQAGETVQTRMALVQNANSAWVYAPLSVPDPATVTVSVFANGDPTRTDFAELTVHWGVNSWDLMGNGLSFPAGEVSQVAIDPADSAIVYLVQNGVPFRSENGGESWIEAGTGLDGLWVNRLYTSQQAPTTLYAVLFPAGLARSSDRGVQWEVHDPPDTGDAPPFHPESFFADPDDATRGWVAGLEFGGEMPAQLYAYRFDNRSWTFVSEVVAWSAGGTPALLVDAGADPLRFFIATGQTGVRYSLDGGTTFDSLGDGFEGMDIRDVAFNPGDANVFYGCGHQGVFTWYEVVGLGSPTLTAEARFGDIGDIDCNAVFAGGPGNDDAVTVGLPLGDVWHSKDQGSTWAILGTRIGGAIRDVAVARDTGTVYAAVQGLGLYRYVPGE